MGLFNDKKEEPKKVEKEKELADKEVALYKERRMLEVDRLVDNYRREQFKDVEKTAVQCVEDTRLYEHDYHLEKEKKGVELAKLTAVIDVKKEIILSIENVQKITQERDVAVATAHARLEVIKEKEATIKLLDETVKVVVGKLSKVDVGSLALNVTTKEAK